MSNEESFVGREYLALKGPLQGQTLKIVKWTFPVDGLDRYEVLREDGVLLGSDNPYGAANPTGLQVREIIAKEEDLWEQCRRALGVEFESVTWKSFREGFQAMLRDHSLRGAIFELRDDLDPEAFVKGMNTAWELFVEEPDPHASNPTSESY
jgi:hypothetical protein